ncbi:MAG TPA: ABC transporter permease [Candidatus Peribacteria bacterium]|nr:ABC transporter permease [Candidatus Peribacteria bacterium]
MRISDTLQTAMKAVSVNRSRAMLTMLGIIIGVGSVVLMSSIGASMQLVILGQISSLGARSMVIFPGSTDGGPNPLATGHDSLTFDDVDALKRLKTIETLAPVIFIPGKAEYGREEASTQNLGVVNYFFENQNIYLQTGRLIDDADNEGAKYVAMLGSDAREKLFGQNDPIGKRVKIGDAHYTVVGLVKPLGSQFFQNVDNRIYVPYNTARQVTGQKYVNYVTMRSTTLPELALEDVKSLLRQRHKIDNPKDEAKKDDFGVRTSSQANDLLGGVSLGLTLFITTIASISLLVGGIGIMNIMIVSVTERTREIGLRKAVGATRRNILLQFLAEAVVLTLTGGLIGAIGGVATAWFAAALVKTVLATYVFVISWNSIFAAFLMAAVTGLVFGIAPARKAANLSPMEALRYE